MSLDDEWFMRFNDGLPELPFQDHPCQGCAVVTGFYREFSDELKRCKPETIEYVSKRWFCHNDVTRACKGNLDNLNRDL